MKRGNDKPRERAQQGLDYFIAKNDWGSISKYIKKTSISKDISKANNSDCVIQKQSSICKIKERTDYNHCLRLESSQLKTRYGATSQIQHNNMLVIADREEEKTNDREGEKK